MKQLKGMDVDIEISLKEYGLAWQLRKDETVFYYGITHDGEEYTRFDWAIMDSNTDIKDEYDWVNFQDITRFTGMTLAEWDEMSLTQKVHDLLSYWGYENVFGTSYTEGRTYEEIIDN